MTIETELRSAFNSRNPSLNAKASARAALDRSIASDVSSSVRRRITGRRNWTVIATAAACVAVLIMVAFLGNSSRPPTNTANDLLLAAAQVRLAILTPGPGEYRHERTIDRSLVTNGHESWDNFTLMEKWIDSTGNGRQYAKTSGDLPPGSPVPSDITQPDYSATSAIDPVNSDVYVELAKSLNGDRSSVKAAINNAIEEQSGERFNESSNNSTSARWWVLSNLMTDQNLPATARETVFGLAAELGLSSEQKATDGLGRSAARVYGSCGDGFECSIYLDTATSEVAELRQTITSAANVGTAVQSGMVDGMIKESTLFFPAEIVSSIPAGVVNNEPSLNQERKPAPIVPGEDLAWKSTGATTATDYSKAEEKVRVSVGSSIHVLWVSPETGKYADPGGTCVAIASPAGPAASNAQARCSVPASNSTDLAGSIVGANKETGDFSNIHMIYMGYNPAVVRAEVITDERSAPVPVKDGYFLFQADTGGRFIAYDVEGAKVFEQPIRPMGS